jgi:hypothetical protein
MGSYLLSIGFHWEDRVKLDCRFELCFEGLSFLHPLYCNIQELILVL